MRYVAGAIFLAVAAGFLVAALRDRARPSAVAPSPDGRAPQAAASLMFLGDVLPSLVIGFLGYVAIKSTFAFWAFDGSRYLSILDLVGFLALLAAYGYWLTARVKRPRRAAPEAVPDVTLHLVDGSGGKTADGFGDADPAGASPGAGRRRGLRPLAAPLAPEGERTPRRRAG